VNKIVSTYETLIELQPDNYTALNNIAIAYRWQRNWAKAEDALRRAVATGYAPVVAHNQLFTSLMMQGKQDDVLRALAAFDSAYPATPTRFQRRAELHFFDRRFDSVDVLSAAFLEATRDPVGRANALDITARFARAQGRLQEGARRGREAVTLNLQNGRAFGALTEQSVRATISAVVMEDRQRAAAALDSALAAMPVESIPGVTRPYAQLALAYGVSGRGDRVAALQRGFDQSRKDMVRYEDDRERATIAGARAYAEERWDEAIRSFRISSDIGECSSCGLPYLAASFDRAGMRDSAIATYRRYVEVPDVMRTTTDQIWLAPSLRRLGELYEAGDDRLNAVKYYREYVDLWKRADPELQPRVAEVRRRISRLSDVETRR
jgi:tetratricopeptide (TPR) repeat protein